LRGNTERSDILVHFQGLNLKESQNISSRLYEEEQEYMAPGLQEVSQLSRLVIKEAKGCRLLDMEGNSFLDFMAGVAVCSLGHSHPKYVKALKAQLDQVSVGSFTTPNRVDLLRLIASITPEGLNKVQLYSGGAEAVEASIRLAKSYTKKFEVLSFWGGFHGKTGGVLGLIGDPFKKHWGTLYPGLHLAPYADCYRCPFKVEYPACGLFCLDFVRKIIENNTAGSLAAIIVETMQGTAGNIIPPPEFLPGLLQIARDNDALLIADEMITGFGRTGMMFGSNHTGLHPDIMTIGKGLGSGFPVSGLISTEEITSSKPFSKPSSSSSSYGGNPLACTAALATVQTIIDDSLVENSRQVGEHLLNGLRGLQEKYEFIGDVRGAGLLIGVELVKDRRTREPMDKSVTRQMFLETVKRGMVCMNYKPNFRINPPLVLSREEADEGLAIIDEVFAFVAESIPYK
jgi:4-aminobutyrate aminotransferase-like enzyme